MTAVDPSPPVIRLPSQRAHELTALHDFQPRAVPEPTFSVSYYFWLIRKAWWKIVIAVLLVTGASVLLAYKLKPEYEATARIAIDLKTPSTVIGQNPGNTSSVEADQYFNTELQVIQSDTVLRPVVKTLHLNPAKSTGVLPDGVRPEDAPVFLKDLKVTHPANSFLINVTYRSPDTMKAAAVANAIAQSYIVSGRETRARSALEESAFVENQMSALKRNMDDSVLALAYYEKQLGVINPEEKTSLLSSRITQLNAEYTEAQNDRVRKQVEYKAIKSGSTAAIEVSLQATALAHMEENVRTAQQKMESVKLVYGTSNAEYKRAATDLAELTRQLTAAQAQVGKRIEVEYEEADKREQMLHQSLLEAKGQFDVLNTSSMHYQELKREAEANRSLYAELYRTVKEAGINGAFQGNGIRITDPARPQLHPVFPNKTVLIGLSFFFSLVLSIIAVLLSDLSDKSLRDPDQVQRVLGQEVVGILPRVAHFADLSPGQARESSKQALVKSNKQWFGSASFYEEAARSVLSTILINHRNRPLRSIMVTSAVQGEGKSSCIAHLAAMHAQQGYRTLLIDADLRCPTQHSYFNMQHEVGLADAITHKLSLNVIRRTVVENPLLDIIVGGNDSNAVCDQVGRAVETILKSAYKEYDLVFIDAPPMLCFAEPIQLAHLVDGVLVVCHAGNTRQQQVSGVLNTLRRVGKTLGIVLNQVHPRLSHSYGLYQSYYRTMDHMVTK